MNENTFEATNKNPVDLSVSIAGIRLRNPVIAASGTFGHGKEYSSLFDVSILGGICTKGLTMSPKIGNNGIRIWETPSGMLNSIGLENPGIPAFLEKDLPYLRQLGPIIIANLSGEESDDYVQGAVHLNKSSVDMIELNISCPNVRAGGIAFGLDPGTAAALTGAVRRVCTNKPLIIKLSPNAPNLAAIALACINAGADALSLVNTFKAMAIDTVNRKPIFDNITAGLSGPSIRPIALRIVWELFNSLKEAKLNIPIIGIGGIACTNDALEFLIAGASAIQVGSATFVDPYTMSKIIDGLHNYLVNHEMSNVNEISIRG
jgi:dihydroorotate dehydrogenase (NAD+) catalytic subunit